MANKGKGKKRTRTIAPLLADGAIRDRLYGRLPVEVKAGLRAIAREENKSVSWVIEEVVIDYFGLKRPRYRTEVRGARRKR